MRRFNNRYSALVGLSFFSNLVTRFVVRPVTTKLAVPSSLLSPTNLSFTGLFSPDRNSSIKSLPCCDMSMGLRPIFSSIISVASVSGPAAVFFSLYRSDYQRRSGLGIPSTHSSHIPTSALAGSVWADAATPVTAINAACIRRRKTEARARFDMVNPLKILSGSHIKRCRCQSDVLEVHPIGFTTCPPPGLPTILPSSITVLPRTMVRIGTPFTFRPSYGVQPTFV